MKTINGVSVEALLQHSEFDPAHVQRISNIPQDKRPEIAIVESDAQWLQHFQTFKSRILAAFEESGQQQEGYEAGDNGATVTILSVNHVGSTSVPTLPAKAVIDIDLVLSSNSLPSESFYVPRLEAAGFQYILREPEWHEHRFFYTWEPMPCNLHVWGPHSPEVERHRIFKERLLQHEDDRELYARTKKECAAISRDSGEAMMEYTLRKEEVIRQILARAFKALGYL